MATVARPPYRLGSVAATAVAVQGIGQKRETRTINHYARAHDVAGFRPFFSP